MKTIHLLTFLMLFLIGADNLAQKKENTENRLVGSWVFEGSEVLYTQHRNKLDKWLTDTLYFYSDNSMKFSYRQEDGILRTHYSKWQIVEYNELLLYERQLKHSITEELPEISLRIDLLTNKKLTLQSPIFTKTNAVQIMNVYFRKLRD